MAESFRPHQGDYFFNMPQFAKNSEEYGDSVSVPIKGIIFLTLSLKPQVFTDRKMQKTAEITKPT